MIYEQKKTTWVQHGNEESFEKAGFNSMSFNELKQFMALSSMHITNINWALKDIKLDTMADFVWAD